MTAEPGSAEEHTLKEKQAADATFADARRAVLRGLRAIPDDPIHSRHPLGSMYSFPDDALEYATKRLLHSRALSRSKVPFEKLTATDVRPFVNEAVDKFQCGHFEQLEDGRSLYVSKSRRELSERGVV